MATSLVSTGVQFPDSTIQTTAATAGSMTLLGTLATTSGPTVTLSGLNLTTYKQVICVVKAVRISASSQVSLLDPAASYSLQISSTASSSAYQDGIITIDLGTGVYVGIMYNASINTPPFYTGATSNGFGGLTTFSTSSTTVAFQANAGNFNAGSILVYGVK